MSVDRLTSRPRRTHEVSNQPPPLEGYNVFGEDRPLVEALRRENAGWSEEKVRRLGGLTGGEALSWGPRGPRLRLRHPAGRGRRPGNHRAAPAGGLR